MVYGPSQNSGKGPQNKSDIVTGNAVTGSHNQ